MLDDVLFDRSLNLKECSYITDYRTSMNLRFLLQQKQLLETWRMRHFLSFPVVCITSKI